MLMAPDVFESMGHEPPIPQWFPGNAVFWTYFADVALIIGGIGLFIPQTARLAAFLSGVMVFCGFGSYTSLGLSPVQ